MKNNNWAENQPLYAYFSQLINKTLVLACYYALLFALDLTNIQIIKLKKLFVLSDVEKWIQ